MSRLRSARRARSLEFLDSVRAGGPVTDATARQRLATIYVEHTMLELIRLRTLTARLKGEQPAPEASIRKLMGDEHGQHVMELARDLVGAAAMLTGGDGTSAAAGASFGLSPAMSVGRTSDGPRTRPLDHAGWYDGYLFSQALTIGGGTADVQRNIIAQRVLGLPHDVDVQRGLSWSDAQRQ